MSRWRNYGLWAAVIAFIPLLAAALGTYDIHVLLPGNYAEVATAFLGILVLAGIVNNPDTESRGFGDDK